MISFVHLCESQKHLDIILEKNPNFYEHIERKIKICNVLIGTIRHLFVHLPRKSLPTICKSFVQLRVDYGDIIYDNPVNESIINKLKKVHYQAYMAITDAIQGTSCESLYKELGLKSLQSRRWYRKMMFFYKILKGLAPKYLFNIILVWNDSCYNERAQSN